MTDLDARQPPTAAIKTAARDDFGQCSTRVGIVTAMPAEAATLRRALSGNRADWPRIICGGIGPSAATTAANSLLASGAQLLISWGVAGGLDPRLLAGSLVLYSSVIDLATETEYACDSRWITQTLRRLSQLDVVRRTALSVRLPALSAAEKAALNSRYHCAVADMESSAIAAVALANGVRFAALRAVADAGTISLPSTALYSLREPRRPRWRIVAALGRRPWELPALIQLGLQYGAALRQLRRAAAVLFGECRCTSLTEIA